MDIYIISMEIEKRGKEDREKAWMQNKEKKKKEKRDLCLLLEKRMENCQAYTSFSFSRTRLSFTRVKFHFRIVA